MALVTSSIFFGAAFYVSVVEQPARLGLDDRAALPQWCPAYRRGFAMQAPLAMISGLFGLLAWWTSSAAAWALGAFAIIANWPYTLIVIMPVNNRLAASLSSGASNETRALVVRWADSVRLDPSWALATAAYLIAALQGGHVN